MTTFIVTLSFTYLNTSCLTRKLHYLTRRIIKDFSPHFRLGEGRQIHTHQNTHPWALEEKRLLKRVLKNFKIIGEIIRKSWPKAFSCSEKIRATTCMLQIKLTCNFVSKLLSSSGLREETEQYLVASDGWGKGSSSKWG